MCDLEPFSEIQSHLLITLRLRTNTLLYTLFIDCMLNKLSHEALTVYKLAGLAGVGN